MSWTGPLDNLGVRFDEQLAQVAADTCAQARVAIGEVMTGRASLARVAREQWLGGHREEFDARSVHLERLAADLMQELHFVSSRIDQAAADARSEISRRADILEKLEKLVDPLDLV